MKTLLYQPRFFLVIYFVVTIVTTLHLLTLGTDFFAGHTWPVYNNYIIFKHSFTHLINGQNLYDEYVPVYWNTYKYSPAFALFMGMFAWLPDPIGMFAWNLLNTLVLFLGIRSLPLSIKQKCFLYWFVLIELVLSLQHLQSNALITGLLLLAFSSFEKKELFKAALWLTCAAFIKIYGAIGFILFVFYPNKLRFIGYSALLCLFFLLVPITATKADVLIWQYKNWIKTLGDDYGTSYGWSVMGWLHTWFSLEAKKAISMIGLILFFAPLTLCRNYKDLNFRILFTAFMLIWVVVFNHRAEPPTYIIAMTGVGIWYFSQAPATWRTCLLWSVFIFTGLSHTDIFPPSVRKDWVYPYFIKAVPCIVACFVLLYKLLSYRKKSHPVEVHTLSNL
jgi:hypothetical protein